MHIERMQVEGGFLDGFDVKFAAGLNVIIGARGTGKTSIIELIRFALAARNHTMEAEKRSASHAQAILNGGEVSVSLGDIFETVVVSRSADDDEPRSQQIFSPPLVLSQTEIETLGLSDVGRLRLLDSFVSEREFQKSEEAAAISAVRSTLKEIDSLEAEIVSSSAGLNQIPTITNQIKELVAQESSFKATSVDMAAKQEALGGVVAKTTSLAIEQEMLDRFGATADNWATQLAALVDDDFGLEDWDGDATVDPLGEFRDRYSKLVDAVRTISSHFDGLSNAASAKREPIQKRRLENDGTARSLRAEISKVADGAGVVARQLGQAQTTLGQLQAKAKIVQDRQTRLKQLRSRRDERLVELETVRNKRYQNRAKAAEEISAALAPQIRIEVEPLGQFGEYAKAVTNALRGSGMKYNDLADIISDRISPRELIGFVDDNDYTGLAEAAQLPRDRAARLLGHLRDNGVADIVTSDIEDNVKMLLLDGLEHKPIESLSAGQRCTVILAMVLQHSQRILVIDQPEDHLDNAYIATTVVKALQNRKTETQIILSTHNANIPVLGGAELVIELSSDGRNGFVQVCKPLDAIEAVEAITKVMEGGREAFERRAEFYEDHHH